MSGESEVRRERVRAVGIGVRDKLGSIWWSFPLRGIFAIALGIFAIFWPSQSLSVLVLAVGLYCIADGATSLVGALRYPELREHIAQALAALGIGAVLVFWPGATVRTLLILVGAAACIAGIGQILTARRLPTDAAERDALMTIGVMATVVGVALALWPGSGVAVISWVIGIAAMLIGALLILLGSRVRRMMKRIGTATTS